MSKLVGTFRAYGPPRNMREETLRAIVQAAAICEEYESRGRPLTLRGLYYQHVARGLIENSDPSYNRLKHLVSEGRLAGLISWTAIEDLGRNLRGYPTWEDPEHRFRDAAADYRRNKWLDQDVYPEVWVEKQAMESVVGRACEELEVDYFACKGYNSHSEEWRAANRFAYLIQQGQRPMVFYLGDHDPSGMHMVDDHASRLAMFTGVPVQVVRIALNRSQVDKYDPPPNPAKMTDSRAPAYVAEHGEHSWELDALSPDVIHEVIQQAVISIRDEAKWEASLAQENSERQMMTDLLDAEYGPVGERHT